MEEAHPVGTVRVIMQPLYSNLPHQTLDGACLSTIYYYYSRNYHLVLFNLKLYKIFFHYFLVRAMNNEPESPSAVAPDPNSCTNSQLQPEDDCNLVSLSALLNALFPNLLITKIDFPPHFSHYETRSFPTARMRRLTSIRCIPSLTNWWRMMRSESSLAASLYWIRCILR